MARGLRCVPMLASICATDNAQVAGHRRSLWHLVTSATTFVGGRMNLLGDFSPAGFIGFFVAVVYEVGDLGDLALVFLLHDAPPAA